MYQDTVSIKGTRNGLVIVLDPNCDYEDIRSNLLHKMETAKGFFKGAKFSLRQQSLTDMSAERITELEGICKQYGLVPNTEEHASTRPNPAKTLSSPVSGKPNADEKALLVRRSLRSGQRISAPGHVVVMGDVNQGAEIVAGGNVLVLGHCRGVIHAGADGNRKAKIIAWQLDPTVLIIANRRYAPNSKEKLQPSCQKAELKGKEIVFDTYMKREEQSAV